MRIVTRDSHGATGAPEPPQGESYYVTIVGVDRLEISDELGNANTPLGDDGFELAVPGVGYSGGYDDARNSGYHELDIPPDAGEYTLKFIVGNDRINIEILKGVGNTHPRITIRYTDLDLPFNVQCLLQFRPATTPHFAYDSDGDGIFETVIPTSVQT